MAYYGRTKVFVDGFSAVIRKNLIGASVVTGSSESAIIPASTNSSIRWRGFCSRGGTTGVVQVFSQRSVISSSRSSSFTARIWDARRFYYIDRYNVRHFKPRGAPRWFRNPRIVFVVVVVVSGVVITVYFGNSETVPYTKRTHFVLLSKSLERQIGEAQFEQIKRSYRGNILPALHPESVRVRLIAKDIIAALQRGIRHQHAWSDLEYGNERWPVATASGRGNQRDVTPLSEGEKLNGRWSRADEILDDSWVQQSRKDAQKRGSEAMTQHLEGLNWEVILVKNPMVNAFCLPGGKIVVFTGLLDHFRTSAEIATVIGHEVGHCIARHAAEGITKNMWVALLQLALLQIISLPDLVNAVSHLLLRLPFSRRMEMEADYIGLLLMAAAGYDPRIAPRVYEKLGKVGGDSPLRDYLSTHPSGKTRAKLLVQAKVMEEAVGMYKEALAGRGIEGFL